MNDRLSTIKQIVISAAKEELLPRFSRVAHSLKSDNSLITEADLITQQRILVELSALYPDVALLGEEMQAQQQTELLQANHAVWCLDPLDGTRNFTYGIPYFATSLALLEGGTTRLAVVYDPVRDECFTAEKNQGAWLNDQPLKLKETGLSLQQSMALVDFKRLPEKLAQKLAGTPPYASQRSFGASALDWCWMAAARCQLYLHGRQNIWDYAAGLLILQEAGGYAETLSGESVFNNSLEPRSAACATEETLFNDWVSWLQRHQV